MWGDRGAMIAFTYRTHLFHVNQTRKLAATASFCASPTVALDLKIVPEPVLQIAAVGRVTVPNREAPAR